MPPQVSNTPPNTPRQHDSSRPILVLLGANVEAERPIEETVFSGGVREITLSGLGRDGAGIIPNGLIELFAALEEHVQGIAREGDDAMRATI